MTTLGAKGFPRILDGPLEFHFAARIAAAMA
jgi:hypothetical protein